MPKFLLKFLQLVGLAKKYEPAVKAAVDAAKPLVKAVVEDVKKAVK